MSILHLCNTFFEWELCDETPDTLERAFTQNPLFLQLQFLPLLYANRLDGLLVTEKPLFPLKRPLCLIDEFPPFDHLETWGYSQLAKVWATQHNIAYASQLSR